MTDAHKFSINVNSRELIEIIDSEANARFLAGRDMSKALNLLRRLNACEMTPTLKVEAGQLRVCWMKHAFTANCVFELEIPNCEV